MSGAYVIPPKAVDELTYDLSDENSIVKQLCYLYKYDKRGNCVKKRLPGTDWIKMVYDIADRLILSQDGNQRLANQWIVNKYAGVEYTYVDYNDYSEGDRVNYMYGWDYNNDIFSPWRNNAPLEIDNTFETLFIPTFGLLKNLNWTKYLKYLQFG